MNTHLRDNLKALGDPWTAYTPLWTAATTNPVLGNGSLTGAFLSAGKLTSFNIKIVIGSTTTLGSGAYILTYPVTAKQLENPGMGGWFLQGSTPNGVICIGLSTTTFRMLTASSNSFATAAVPFALATGNQINVGGVLEAA